MCWNGSLVGGGFDNLQLVRSDMRQDASVNILDASGAVGAQTVLDARQARGSLVVERVLPALFVAVLAVGLFSGFMFAHVRRVTIDLVTREAAGDAPRLHDVMSGLPNRAFLPKRLDQELARLQRRRDGAASSSSISTASRRSTTPMATTPATQLIWTVASACSGSCAGRTRWPARRRRVRHHPDGVRTPTRLRHPGPPHARRHPRAHRHGWPPSSMSAFRSASRSPPRTHRPRQAA